MVYIKKAKGRIRRFPLYWNFISKQTGEQEIEGQTMYYFLIVNTDPREINDINGKLYGHIASRSIISVKQKNLEGNVGDLHYLLLEIDTSNIRLELSKIKKAYNGSLEKDSRLYPRKDEDELKEYVKNKLEKLIFT